MSFCKTFFSLSLTSQALLEGYLSPTQDLTDTLECFSLKPGLSITKLFSSSLLVEQNKQNVSLSLANFLFVSDIRLGKMLHSGRLRPSLQTLDYP
jgi:hypothetical protein